MIPLPAYQLARENCCALLAVRAQAFHAGVSRYARRQGVVSLECCAVSHLQRCAGFFARHLSDDMQSVTTILLNSNLVRAEERLA
jgi:hypothetical protein